MSTIEIGDQRVSGGLHQQGSGNVGGSLVINQGFRVNSTMRPGARTGLFVGLATALAGLACTMTYSVAYYLRVDEAMRTGREPRLPPSQVLVPVGQGLMFIGITLMVMSLCVSRERIITPLNGRR